MAKDKKTVKPEKPKNKILKEGWQTKNRYICILTQNEIFTHFAYRLSDKKLFVLNNKKNAEEGAPKVLEGCGGTKNILSVDRVNMAIRVKFKSHYLINKETLNESGLVHLWIGDHELIAIFDYIEAKHIALDLKQKIKVDKSYLIEMDLD